MTAVKANTVRRKNGIIHAMKNRAKAAHAPALTIVGGAVASTRGAAVEISQSRQTWQINA